MTWYVQPVSADFVQRLSANADLAGASLPEASGASLLAAVVKLIRVTEIPEVCYHEAWVATVPSLANFDEAVSAAISTSISAVFVQLAQGRHADGYCQWAFTLHRLLVAKLAVANAATQQFKVLTAILVALCFVMRVQL